MKIPKLLIIALSLLAWSIFDQGSAFSEQFVRVFAGPAWTQSTDVKHSFATVQETYLLKDIDFRTGPAVGWGFGHWFQAFPYLGLGVDVHLFKFNSDKQSTTSCFTGLSFPTSCEPDVEVSQHYRATAIAFPLMARLPLSVSKEYPNGRTQPYVLVGPTIFVATYTDPGGHFSPRHQKDTDTSVGVTAGAGLTFMVTPSIDLFTEYRFTHFSPQFRVTDDFGIGFDPPAPAKVKLDANTHRLLFGISYHFNLFGG